MGDVCVCVCASDYVGQAPALNTHLHFLSSFYLNFCFSLNFDDFQLSIPSSAFSESINSTWVKGKCPTWKPKTKTCKHNFFSSYYFYKFVADKRADCPAETWIARPPADKTSSEKYKKNNRPCREVRLPTVRWYAFWSPWQCRPPRDAGPSCRMR